MMNIRSWLNQRKARKSGKSSGHLNPSERSAAFHRLKRLPKGR